MTGRTSCMYHWSLFLSLTFLLFGTDICNASGNFVPVNLAKGVYVELPRNWTAISNNHRITLDSAVQAKGELAGNKHFSSDLNFAANYYDDRGNTVGIFNIRYYPQITLTQADSRAATQEDTRQLDAAIRDTLAESEKIYGVKVLSWMGTKKVSINGIIAFVSEYRRAGMSKDSPFRVRLVRIFHGVRSFTVTASYSENQEFLLRPICDRIIQSIHM